MHFLLYSRMDWHSDITFEPIPSDYTMLKLHTLPTINGSLTGGDTIFASYVPLNLMVINY